VLIQARCPLVEIIGLETNGRVGMAVSLDAQTAVQRMGQADRGRQSL